MNVYLSFLLHLYIYKSHRETYEITKQKYMEIYLWYFAYIYVVV